MHTPPLDTVNVQRRRRCKKEKANRIHVDVEMIRGYLPGSVVALLASLASCFSLPSPFAITLLMAFLAQNGKCPKGACLGMGMGVVLRLIWGIDADLAQALVFFLLAVFGKRKMDSTLPRYSVLFCALLLRAVPSMIGREAMEIMRQMGGVMLGICVMPAMERCAELWKTNSREKTRDDLLCLALPWMVLLCGGAHIQLFQVNLGVLLAEGSLLLAAWTSGAAAAAAMGIGAGFALLSGGIHVIYFMAMPFAGLIAGCFQQKNRGLCALAFSFSAVVLVYITLQKWPEGLMGNLLAGNALFLLLPRKKAKKWMQTAIGLQWTKPRENAFIQMRMQQWVQAVRRLSQMLPHTEIPMESREAEAETLAEKLCQHCDRLPICWRDEYEKTKAGMEALLEGPEADLQAINRYFEDCERMKEIPGLLDAIYEKRQQILHKRHLAAYERHMLETHLAALSEAAQLISLEGLNKAEEETEWMALGEEALEKMHFAGRMAFVKRIDGHITAGVQSDWMPIQPATAEKVRQQLSLYLGVPLDVTQKNASRVILEEAPPFELAMGHATAGAWHEGMGELQTRRERNGDAVVVRSLWGGRMMFALSDGMGHGKAAGTESRRTLEMLADCLDAGYTREQAMCVVNGAMLNATGGEIFATVDMGVLDQWTGEAEMNKLGACSSYLVQGQKIVKLSGEALPLGILEHVMPSEKKVSLAEGDRVIFMSDGIADAYDSEEDVMRMLYRRLSDHAQEMADAVLQDAMERQNGMPRDDMTVLCIQLMARYYRKRRSLSA